jgi:hypothetical protein
MFQYSYVAGCRIFASTCIAVSNRTFGLYPVYPLSVKMVITQRGHSQPGDSQCQSLSQAFTNLIDLPPNLSLPPWISCEAWRSQQYGLVPCIIMLSELHCHCCQPPTVQTSTTPSSSYNLIPSPPPPLLPTKYHKLTSAMAKKHLALAHLVSAIL